MSNVSIYEKNWTDLVFEDKNKAYGAYQLRRDNARTTFLAFFSVISIISLLIGGWLIFSSFSAHPAAVPKLPPIVVTKVKLDPYVKPVVPKAEQPKAQSSSPKKSTNLANMVAAKPEEAKDDVVKNSDVTPQTSTATDGPGTGPVIDIPNNGGSGGGTEAAPKTPSGPVTTNLLDKLPQYPGGMEKFYQYVGNSIDKEEIASNAMSVNVIMSFVIETDGSMTDIRVLRSSDKNLEKEAIRVLRKSKVKWTPGVLNGDYVRTQYVLPIRVTL